jgi:hypothetical protein
MLLILRPSRYKPFFDFGSGDCRAVRGFRLILKCSLLARISELDQALTSLSRAFSEIGDIVGIYKNLLEL